MLGSELDYFVLARASIQSIIGADESPNPGRYCTSLDEGGSEESTENIPTGVLSGQ